MRALRGLLVLALLTVLGSAAATPSSYAVVVEGPYLDRCYAFVGPAGGELWVEANGVLDGGEPTLTGEPSGLQREPVGDVPADFRITSTDEDCRCQDIDGGSCLLQPVRDYVFCIKDNTPDGPWSQCGSPF